MTPSPSSALQAKYSRLLDHLKDLHHVAVAFSGGVDSTLLLYAAIEALGARVLAITLATPYVPRQEIDAACELAKMFGVVHRVLELPFPKEITTNPADRCYLCKKNLFSGLQKLAVSEGISAIVEGTNSDDLKEYRPGIQALKELGVISPLVDAGFSTSEIRHLSQQLELPTWDKPSFACLLSRIPVGVRITKELLIRIERAETFLTAIGFQGARVRSHGTMARIEVPESRILDLVKARTIYHIDAHLKKLGYNYVAVDLAGYQTGSMNPPDGNGDSRSSKGNDEV